MFRRKLFAKILVLEKDLQKRKDSEVISFIMAKLEMAKNMHLQICMNTVKSWIITCVTNLKEIGDKMSKYISIEFHFIINLKRPACAPKQDRLVLATIRYLFDIWYGKISAIWNIRVISYVLAFSKLKSLSHWRPCMYDASFESVVSNKDYWASHWQLIQKKPCTKLHCLKR